MEPLKSNDPSVLGDWRVMGRLGQGGFGTVFLAEKGAQKAAIKVIKSEFVEESDARQRLTTEADVLSKLSNPYIGKILDSDLKGELPWIATEFINGPTLDNKVKYEGPLKEVEWFHLAAHLFHAIVAANELRVIHKDIKPSNIILGETGTKLIDFGIAHIEGRTKTVVFGDREGSTPFSSPEHFTPRSNPKMDVFSAAATLAFAGKGSGVWIGENDLQLMRSINDDEPDLTGLTENQVNFLTPLFEKNPSDRSSAANAQSSAHEYIEYLLDKDNRNKPVALRIKKSLSRRLRNPWIKWGMPVGLVSTIFLVSMLSGQSIPNEVKFWLADVTPLTSKQLGKITQCENLVNQKEYKTASLICREPADLGDTNSQYFLGVALGELGKNKEAKSWVLKAAEQKSPKAFSWLAFNALEESDYTTTLKLGRQAADLGDISGIRAVGLAYGYLEQYELAAEWYQKAWELGDAWGAILLGYHYQFDDPNEIEAEKWLQLAASTPSFMEFEGAFDYAEFLRKTGKVSTQFCPWYKKSADAEYKEDELDIDAVASFKKYCLGVESSPAPVDSPAVKNRLPKPVESKKPKAVSDSFEVSAPLASNVQVNQIFGRAFKDRLNYWNVPLTMVRGGKVPELTAIQFRMIGFANSGWMDVPYKLKTDSTFGTVYAEVDDMIFAVLFKNIKYCPEFRVAREENGEIVQIWEKGQPECATDYNP